LKGCGAAHGKRKEEGADTDEGRWGVVLSREKRGQIGGGASKGQRVRSLSEERVDLTWGRKRIVVEKKGKSYERRSMGGPNANRSGSLFSEKKKPP